MCATCHTSKETIDILREKFSDRVISLEEMVAIGHQDLWQHADVDSRHHMWNSWSYWGYMVATLWFTDFLKRIRIAKCSRGSLWLIFFFFLLLMAYFPFYIEINNCLFITKNTIFVGTSNNTSYWETLYLLRDVSFCKSNRPQKIKRDLTILKGNYSL